MKQRTGEFDTEEVLVSVAQSSNDVVVLACLLCLTAILHGETKEAGKRDEKRPFFCLTFYSWVSSKWDEKFLCV